jgi:hypothetical protein
MFAVWKKILVLIKLRPTQLWASPPFLAGRILKYQQGINIE